MWSSSQGACYEGGQQKDEVGDWAEDSAGLPQTYLASVLMTYFFWKLKAMCPACRCGNCKCRCSDFFFIVAEGSWWAACARCLCTVCICSRYSQLAQPWPPHRILRCQCKHKHTEHDPVSKACTKAACHCEGFHSPWHCNCNHPWAEHTQVGQQHLHGVSMALSAICATGWPATCVSAISSPVCSTWRRSRCSHWRLCWRGFKWHHSMRPWRRQTLLLAMTWQAGIT